MLTNSQIYDALANLNRDRNPNIWDERTKTGAPHKPILLLSIIDAIQNGWITSNKFNSVELISESFFDYWNKVFSEKRETTISLPLFHMKSESFWILNYKQGENEFSNSPSLGSLLKRLENFEIEEHLFDLLSDYNESERIRRLLLDNYFSDETAVKISRAQSIIKESHDYSESLLSLVEEPFNANHNSGAEKIATVKRQIRDKGFSRLIRQIYKHKCSVCGDVVITPNGKSIIDAAHIIPWSTYKNDDPRNGLSLCKSHHWMFDNYMLTVNEDYTLSLSKHLNRYPNVVSVISERKNEKLFLPSNNTFHPSKKALSLHNHFFDEAHRSWKG